MAALNEATPFYEPGQRITVHADSAITGKRFVGVAGNRQSSAGGLGGNILGAHATAGGTAIGVAAHDCADEKKVAVITGGVVPVTADGSISAGAQVEVGTAGKAKAKNTGIVVGVAVNGASDGAVAEILLK